MHFIKSRCPSQKKKHVHLNNKQPSAPDKQNSLVYLAVPALYFVILISIYMDSFHIYFMRYSSQKTMSTES